MDIQFNQYIDIEMRRLIDDFQRDVWCLVGMPIDATRSAETLEHLWFSARDPLNQQPLGCFLSTPNLNFVIAALSDESFRDSVVSSDWVVADGMPLVWLAKKLGIPIKERVAGSSLVESLRLGLKGKNDSSPLKVFFFGGPDGVAQQACEQLQSERSGLTGVGYHSPGFGTLESMSSADKLMRLRPIF
jgi:N-acetylglucosaminyldiphosphoundecaprenol N-acetyl-beta-D-mannosaminyltransferase